MNSYELFLKTIQNEQNNIKTTLKNLQDLRHKDEENKAVLQSYRQEYLTKMNSSMEYTNHHLQRYHSFVHQLDSLIAEQDRKLAISENECTALMNELAKKQRKIDVLKDLILKKRQQAEQQQQKREQRFIDDLISRGYNDSTIP